MISASVQEKAQESRRAFNKPENEKPLKHPTSIRGKSQQANFRTTAEMFCLHQEAGECKEPAGRSESSGSV